MRLPLSLRHAIHAIDITESDAAFYARNGKRIFIKLARHSMQAVNACERAGNKPSIGLLCYMHDQLRLSRQRAGINGHSARVHANNIKHLQALRLLYRG